MSPCSAAALSGFLTCATLIVAIGAQNMFVLRHGLRGVHILPVVLFCGGIDTLLVSAGVAGAGSALVLLPRLSAALTLAGAAFLACYGALALRRAIGAQALVPAGLPVLSLGQTLATTAAFTLLNPHVYLDTVLLMGATGASHPAEARPLFVVGAAAASFGWFGLIGFGARRLAPLFARPGTWRLLDTAVGFVMLSLAARLIWPIVPDL